MSDQITDLKDIVGKKVACTLRTADQVKVAFTDGTCVVISAPVGNPVRLTFDRDIPAHLRPTSDRVV